MKYNPNRLDIKAKVYFGFGIAFLAAIIAGYYSYTGVRQIMGSVYTLAEPDIRTLNVNHVINDISDADALIKEYTLTNQTSYLLNYEEKVSTIERRLDSLKLLFRGQETQAMRIDSIAGFFATKTDGINKLLELKAGRSHSYFSERALSVVENSRTISKNKLVGKDSNNSFNNQPLEANEDLELLKEDKKVSFFRRVFGQKDRGKNGKDEQKAGRRDKNKTPELKNLTLSDDDQASVSERSIPQTRKDKAGKPDDEAAKIALASNMLDSLAKAISVLSEEENMYFSLMSSQELSILEKDRQIKEKINMLMNDVIREAREQASLNSQNAKDTVRKSGYVVLSITVLAIISSLIFINLIINDISQRDFFRQKLQMARERAEQLARAKEEFMLTMSHEIRTPLNVIQGFTEQLKNTSLRKHQEKYLDAISRSSDHLLSTVNEILDYAKLEAGMMQIEKIPFQVNQVVQEVYEALQLKAKEKGIELNYSFDGDTPELLLGDPFRLRQILFNLVHNGIKFTNTGSVNISARVHNTSDMDSVIEFHVKDTGIGIEKYKIKKIFHDFTQADSSTTRRYGGTGLGLTICKNLVELLGGTIRVTSEPGVGSDFTFALHFVRATAKDIAEPVAGTLRDTSKLSGLRILVIDDDILNQLLTETILRKWNVNVFLADTGESALDQIEKKHINLILTDIQMPDMSGVEVANAIREHKNPKLRDIPVIALTANVKRDEMEQYLSAGINDYLLKPFKEMELFDKISQVLEMVPEALKAAPIKQLEDEDLYNDGVNLRDFNAFADGDPETMIILLQTWLENNKKNASQLKRYLQRGNWDDLADLAHKMIPSYEHLGLRDIASELKSVERIIRNGQPKDVIPSKISEVLQVSKKTEDSISINISSIRSKMAC